MKPPASTYSLHPNIEGNLWSSANSAIFTRRDRVVPSGETIMASGRACRTASDRKSTRLNSSHTVISYAVFCLKKKKTQHSDTTIGDSIADEDRTGVIMQGRTL